MIHNPLRNLSAGCVLLVSIAAGLAIGCGGSQPPAEAPAPEPSSDEDSSEESGMAVSSDVGGLNEGKVNRAFEGAIPALQKCLNRGSQKLEFLGGAVAFFVEVNGDGEVSHAHLEQSTLGDRETEKCMLNALKAQSWPKPVGGKVGHARKSFDFDPPNDVRPPTEGDSAAMSAALEEKADAVAECKSGASGTFTATVYVDTEGKALGAGVVPPDAAGEAAVDCLVSVLKETTYPSPGSWPAKVSFSL